MSHDPAGAPAPKPHRSPFENWISLSGAIVAAGSFFAFVFLFAIQALTGDRNQYLGILTFVVAPLFLITGLLAILVGWIIHRRRLARTDPDAPRALLTVDLSRPRDRRNFGIFLTGAFVFLLLTAFGSYETFHYSESVEFCGTLCHTVMEPEYAAYQRGEHARVACVQCHVGGGAGYYLKSKINGAYQLYSLAFDKYNRPIPTPIHGLRPAQDTCENCHWPERFTGSLERRYEHLLSDKENTPYSIRLLLAVGGANASHGPIGGIHWHMSKEHKVEYYADDPQRQNILWVRTTLPDGTGRTYRKGDFKDDPPAAQIRRMDCVDCHTRPAHNFRAPNDALERAIKSTALDLAALPAFKRHAVAALTAEYATVPEAEAKIAATLRAKYPAAKTEAAIALVQTVYRENFFPLMQTSWKAYPDNIGHKNWPGCFRCHNDELLAGADKPRITQNDCNSCHVILAQGRGAQLHQLAPDGYEFAHPDGEVSGMYCSDCHNGANQ